MIKVGNYEKSENKYDTNYQICILISLTQKVSKYIIK